MDELGGDNPSVWGATRHNGNAKRGILTGQLDVAENKELQTDSAPTLPYYARRLPSVKNFIVTAVRKTVRRPNPAPGLGQRCHNH